MSFQGPSCCNAPAYAHRLMRLVSVTVDGRLAVRGVDRACTHCGSAVLYSGETATLCPFELHYARRLCDKERAFGAAAAAGGATDANALDLPNLGDLADMGLSARIWARMLLDPARVSRNTLLSHLGLTPGAHRFINVPGPLGSVRLDEYAVLHLEEDTGARWEPGHVGYIPLVESTLTHPFEIWYGGGSRNAVGQLPNYRFLSLYQLDAVYMTHIVIYNPRRGRVITSHRLTGWPQTLGRRSGIPIYAAYVR
jgi:hypothetical protein